MGMSVTISAATDEDAEQILKLQYLCYQTEAQRSGDWRIAPLTESLAELRVDLREGCVLVARLGDEVVGAVRATVDEDAAGLIGRLFVHPRMRRHGLGTRLLARVEQRLAAERAATRYRLLTGRWQESGLNLYRRCGYVAVGTESGGPGRVTLVAMEKEVSAREFTTGA